MLPGWVRGGQKSVQSPQASVSSFPYTKLRQTCSFKFPSFALFWSMATTQPWSPGSLPELHWEA